MTDLELEQQFEQLVDKVGIERIMRACQSILMAKAQHLRENWQDERQAKQFDAAAKIVNHTSTELSVLLG